MTYSAHLWTALTIIIMDIHINTFQHKCNFYRANVPNMQSECKGLNSELQLILRFSIKSKKKYYEGFSYLFFILYDNRRTNIMVLSSSQIFYRQCCRGHHATSAPGLTQQSREEAAKSCSHQTVYCLRFIFYRVSPSAHTQLDE